MKTSRLKTIVIAILALVNAFLLALLASRAVQVRAARARAEAELMALYAASGVELPQALIPREAARSAAAEPARDPDAEAAFAGAILGACTAEDAGGGIYRYLGESGSCLIRASGAVEAALARPVDDPEAFAGALFSAWGYEALAAELDADGTGAVSAVRVLDSGPVFNARLTLQFLRNSLVSVTGSFVPAVETGEGEPQMDGVTALARFLDYSNGSGEVCTAVTGVRGGYLLQSAASASQRLLPAWCVSTDVNQYYMNMASGEVTRET